MNSLIGTYECKVDTKGRLMLPSGLKKQLLPMLEEGFVLKRSVFQPCLELYPMSQWNALMEKMNGLNRFNKKNNDFINAEQRKLPPSSHIANANSTKVISDSELERILPDIFGE